MKIREYALLPESDYNGEYDRQEAHFMIKHGTVADMIHDSSMLWTSEFDKIIPPFEKMNKILAEGEFERLACWEPFTIDEDEYNKVVEKLLSISMLKPYRLDNFTGDNNE